MQTTKATEPAAPDIKAEMKRIYGKLSTAKMTLDMALKEIDEAELLADRMLRAWASGQHHGDGPHR